MPYVWVDPDPFLVYRDVTIYYIYQHNHAENPVREYWYGFDNGCADDADEGSFDIRDVEPLLLPEVRAACGNDHQAILKALIDAGYLEAYGFMIDGFLCDIATSIREGVTRHLAEGRTHVGV